jgi:hypothetical protein
LFSSDFVGRQRLAPETVKLGTTRSQTGTIELINPLISGGPILDQTCILQNPEMLRDRWLADRNGAGQVADGAG